MEPEVFMFLRCLFGFKFTPDRFLIGWAWAGALLDPKVQLPLLLGATCYPASPWWSLTLSGFLAGVASALLLFVVWVLHQ